jgi:probable selenate reductase FAD-binding subunit
MRNLRLYYRPTTAAEAIKLKREHGDRAVYLAGGTDLLVHKPERAEVAIDIRHAGLAGIDTDGGDVVIGGAALLRDAEREVEGVAGGMLTHALRETAPWLIRNAATVAGNIANASPAADSIPALMVLEAQLDLMNGTQSRVALEDVLLGPHLTSLGDQLILGIRIPERALHRSGVFIKHSRSKSDIAQVNVAVAVSRDGDIARDVRIALGAVAPTVIRVPVAESLLEGQQVTDTILRRVERVVTEEVRPITDWRASEWYRRRLSGVLVRRALERLFGQERG